LIETRSGWRTIHEPWLGRERFGRMAGLCCETLFTSDPP